MNGPYPVREVYERVQPGSIGAYILSSDGSRAKYVGRSDSDLRGRIAKSADEGRYKYFWMSYESSPGDAYLRECQWWHQYNPPDNAVHPAVPAGALWRCPVQRCGWC